MMLRSKIFQRSLALLPLYEQNYMLFRLVVPLMPADEGWFALEAAGHPPVYLHRLGRSPYTSEWLLGHFFAERRRRFSPDYTIRVYHDARLAEALPPQIKPVGEVRAYKLALNRGLGEWLEYCHRHRYRLSYSTVGANLPLPEQVKNGEWR